MKTAATQAAPENGVEAQRRFMGTMVLEPGVIYPFRCHKKVGTIAHGTLLNHASSCTGCQTHEPCDVVVRVC